MTGIALDTANAIVFARVEGFLDTERLLGLSWSMDRAVLDLRDRVWRHGRLIDLSDAKVAPPTAIHALSREIADPRRAAVRARRVAYFGASPLLQQQIIRLCALRPGLALFDDRKSAHAWVMGGGCDDGSLPGTRPDRASGAPTARTDHRETAFRVGR